LCVVVAVGGHRAQDLGHPQRTRRERSCQAEHAGRDAQLGCGPGVASGVFVLGDFRGDPSELGGHSGFVGGDALVGVEDLVVFAAAGERIETMCAMPASRM
jgi:hypothetical protein